MGNDDAETKYNVFQTRASYSFALRGQKVPMSWSATTDSFSAATSLHARYWFDGYLQAASSRDEQLAIRVEQVRSVSIDLERLETLRAEHSKETSG